MVDDEIAKEGLTEDILIHYIDISDPEYYVTNADTARFKELSIVCNGCELSVYC
jgi:hypothetical protein